LRNLRLLKSLLSVAFPIGLLVALVPSAAAAGFTITPTTLPTGWVGTPYSVQLTTSGGTGTVVWQSSDVLLAGLHFTTAGVISGTPTAWSTTGSSVFTVTATDSAKPAHTATAQLTYIIDNTSGSFKITTTSLATAYQWDSYSATVASSGGTGKVTYTLINGTVLPQGISLSGAGAITGTPTFTSGGTADWIMVQATDSSAPTPKTATAFLGFTIAANPVTISPLTLPTATVGAAYTATLTANGGAGPYTWSLPDNTQFPGLTLTAAGVLSGTPTSPTQVGSPMVFRVKATDSSNPKNTPIAGITLTINPSPISVAPLTLPNATVGQPYTTTLTASGGKGPYTWAPLTNNFPPAGLTLSSGGVLNGTPTVPSPIGGVSRFGVTVTDSSNPKNSVIAWITITVGVSPLQVTSATLPPATVGVPYSTQLAATGGVSPYLWSFAKGSNYPLGLQISPSGVLSGIPATSSGPNPTSFVVQVMDSSTAHVIATGTVNLQINANPLVITSISLPTGVVGVSYSAQLASTGGTGNVTWKQVTGAGAGTLVAPLTVSAAGLVAGTPTASTNGPGFFTVTATDQASPAHKTTAVISYIVNPSSGGFKITTTSLANGTTGQTYSAQFTSTGGTGAVTWSVPTVINSTFPAGMNLSSSGLFSGIPQSSVQYTFAVQARDSAATPRTVIAWLTFTVNQAKQPVLTLTGTTVPPGYVGTPYTAQLQATGGSLPYTWTLKNPGSVPAWLKLSSSGAITGTPTVADPTLSFDVQLTDGSKPTANTASATISLPVYNAVASCAPVSATGNAKLKGNYAFQATQVNLSGGPSEWLEGSVTADGNGNITAAQFDSNGLADIAAKSGTFTGTYAIGSDYRGLMSFVLSSGGGGSRTVNFCIALDSLPPNGAPGAALSGRMVEDDGSGKVTSGSFYAQGASSPTVASLKGSYVFGLQGARLGNGLAGRRTVVGYVTLDGAGSFSAGELDINSDEYDSKGNVSSKSQSQVAVTGTYTVASSGRGTLAVTTPTAGTLNFAFYLTASNQALILQTDAAVSQAGQPTNSVMSGKLYARSTGTFNNATLSGTSVFVSRGLSNSGNNPPGRKIMAGLLNWDGSGNVTGSADENNAGAVTLAATNTFTATYSVDANGRAAVQSGSGSGPYFYLIGPNQGVGLEASTGAGFYTLENQVAPGGGFSLSSFNGGYSLGALWYSAAQEVALTGELSANGAGALTDTVDQNQAGDVQVGLTQALTYTAAATGRFVLSSGSNPTAVQYFVTPRKAYRINIDGSTWEPLLEINQQ